MMGQPSDHVFKKKHLLERLLSVLILVAAFGLVVAETLERAVCGSSD